MELNQLNNQDLDLEDLNKDELLGFCNKQSKRLRRAMEAANLAWWEMKLPSGEVKFSDNKAKMLNYSPSKFEHFEDFTDLLHPDDYDDAMKAMKDHLEGKKERYETEYRIKKKNGDYKWFRDIGSITEKREDYKKVTGVVIDIDNRKNAEENIEIYHKMISKVKEAEESLKGSEFGEQVSLMLGFDDLDDFNKFSREIDKKNNVKIKGTETREDEVVAEVEVVPPTRGSY